MCLVQVHLLQSFITHLFCCNASLFIYFSLTFYTMIVTRMNMDFYCLQKEAIDSYVHCFNFFFEKVCSVVSSVLLVIFIYGESSDRLVVSEHAHNIRI